MSLIRNGGFERGSTEFWTLEGTGVLEISDLLPYSGVYCAKFTATTTLSTEVMHNDYIPVNVGGIVSVSGGFKSTAVKNVSPYIYYYDSDYSYVTGIHGIERSMDGGWLDIKTDFAVPPGIAYARIGYRVWLPAIGDIFYADSIDGVILTPSESIHGEGTLFEENNVSASGDSTTDRKDMKAYKTFTADIEVEFSSGTNETLDVTVYERAIGREEVLIGTFAQKLGAGNERIVLSNAAGSQMFIKYVLAGTNPVFDFNVYINAKG